MSNRRGASSMIDTKEDKPPAAGSSSGRMLDRIASGKRAWVRADIRREDWFFPLPPECLAELEDIIEELRKGTGPVEKIDAGRFRMPACRELMQRVKAVLDDGVRFAVIDRLPDRKSV